MEAREGPPDYVVATYREIAEHFGLKGPDQARTKAKRAAWTAEPQNHPADTLHIRVPRNVWDGASHARERGLSLSSFPTSERVERASQVPSEIPHLVRAFEGQAALLREERDRERRLGDEARAEAVQQRERAGRAEAERDAERAARERAEVRAERAERAERGFDWTIVRRIARALRRLFMNLPGLFVALREMLGKLQR